MGPATRERVFALRASQLVFAGRIRQGIAILFTLLFAVAVTVTAVAVGVA